MLYNIIKQLQETPSTNDKLAIMQANKDNELFKEYMRLVTCPSVSFYITEKTFPEVECIGDDEVDERTLATAVHYLAERKITGNNAKEWVKCGMQLFSKENGELYKMLLLKDIRAKIGVTLVNKVWPNLCIDVPYQRCSLPDEKTLAKFKTGETFIVQTKCDGSFATLVMEENGSKVSLYTRNGNSYPAHVVEHLMQGSYNWEGARKGANHALEGELLCFRNGEMLSRKEGNGLLNSLMQGADVPSDVLLKHVLWNYLPLKDWKDGKTDKGYNGCFTALYYELEMCLNSEHFDLVDHWYVDSLEEAYKFNQEQLAKGLEGSIIKTLSHKWKNGTSKECLKLKVEVEIDLLYKGMVEGTGKAAGMLGAMKLESSCGKVKVDVGTGFTDKQRQELWTNPLKIGDVITIKANDLLDKQNSDTMSLFLPVFIEMRTDKDEADSLEKIKQMFEAVKQGEVNA